MTTKTTPINDNTPPLRGQWLGGYTGSSNGLIVVNIDDRKGYHSGVAYLIEAQRTELPDVAVVFSMKPEADRFQSETSLIWPIDPATGLTGTWENIKGHYPNAQLSKHADVKGRWTSKELALSWTTDTGAYGTCVLPRSQADQPSEIPSLQKDWSQYKEYAATLEGRYLLFRGQTKPWRLRTFFHRAGRANLIAFITEDIQALHRQLSARTRHVFNLESPNENGAFLNLVQHHGYPTPLLDWTYSPYVAAFFAYRGITNAEARQASAGAKVRVHVFDQLSWRTHFAQPLNLLRAHPFVSISEFIAIENERMIPQQAASTLTNLDDIESYVRTKEVDGKQYLTAIDLPVHERAKVIEELSFMGITAGSLFPGLEGACEELRERNFDI